MKDEIVALQEDYESRKAMVSSLTRRFQFYQDLRGYINDLVECLDEKVGLIQSLRVCLFVITIMSNFTCVPLMNS